MLEKRGLCRGRGWETTSDVSIFEFHHDPELTEVLQQIYDLAIPTIKLMIDEGKVNSADVAQNIGLDNYDTLEVA